MLVLTRREEQKIVFPTLGIKVDVLRIRGNVVKIGIEAPDNVPIVRDELVSVPPEAAVPVPPAVNVLPREVRHALLNRLHAGTLALHLLRKQADAGKCADADRTLQRVVTEFEALERELKGTPTADGSSSAASSVPSKPAALPNGAGKRALVVEDNSNECELLAGFLRMCGYEVETVGNGIEALERLAKESLPDVVLLDMIMPRCNGAATIQAIRQTPQFAGLKVFAISGTRPDELGVPTGPRGVDRWFSKPVNPETLVREMSRELSQHAVV